MTLNHAQRSILDAARAPAASPAPLEPWELAERDYEPLRRPQSAAAATGPVPLDDQVLETRDALYRRAVDASTAIRNTRARAAYLRLVLVAFEVAGAQGISPHATEHTFFSPGEAVARDILVFSRTTMWRYRKAWRRAGLVDSRQHATTAFGQTRRDGTVWTVRFRFNPRKPARVPFEHLAHQGYRDLEDDIRHGRTAYAQLHRRGLKQSDNPRERREIESLTMYWALPPAESSAPLPLTVSTPSQIASSASILELRHAGRRERGPLVDQVAHAIARELNDHRSLSFYRWTLWQLLRLLDTGSDLLEIVHQQVLRARADHNERFARRPGALLQSRLKAGGILDAIRSAPRNRVGTMRERA